MLTKENKHTRLVLLESLTQNLSFSSVCQNQIKQKIVLHTVNPRFFFCNVRSKLLLINHITNLCLLSN